MKPALQLHNLKWIEELLPDEVVPEPMHDGIGYYLDEKLVLILVESNKTRIHRGIEYPFQIWNGCFFPIEKIKQNAVINRFLFLENHPALPNCLYLPAENEDFADELKQVLREIIMRNPLFGIFKAIGKPKRRSIVDVSEPLNTSRPRLFSEDDDEQVPTKPPKKISSPKAKPKKTKPSKKDENQFLLAKLKKK